jgi:hypothetical protein
LEEMIQTRPEDMIWDEQEVQEEGCGLATFYLNE